MQPPYCCCTSCTNHFTHVQSKNVYILSLFVRELLEGFTHTETFLTALQYAQDLKVLLWSDSAQHRMVVTSAGAATMRQYIMNQ
jgi:hypothetical protein